MDLTVINDEELNAAKMAATIILIEAIKKKKQQQQRKRKLWTRKWLLRRKEQGEYENLMRELALEDPEGYRRYIRMSTANFELLLSLISKKIAKQDTRMRESISAGERLAVTLRYLATGSTQFSIGYNFRIAPNTLSGIISEVCIHLYQTLQEMYLEVPATGAEWESTSRDFNNKWNFPNCIGAMDGKHVKITPPPGSGSMYYNYKGDFSIVLLAVVDANLKFLYIDVGTNGRISDGGVWGKCSLKSAIEARTLEVPNGCFLPSTELKLPYVLVADDAFPLSSYIMKPHSGNKLSDEEIIFNYRLSRARRVSENAFGVLAARFQIYKSPIITSEATAKKIVKATCCLHNFLMTHGHGYVTESSLDTEDIVNLTLKPGDWRDFSREAFDALEPCSQKATHYSKQIQTLFTQYFNTVGAVPWQNAMARLH